MNKLLTVSGLAIAMAFSQLTFATKMSLVKGTLSLANGGKITVYTSQADADKLKKETPKGADAYTQVDQSNVYGTNSADFANSM